MSSWSKNWVVNKLFLKLTCFFFLLFLFPKIPDAEKDPDFVALKGRAYLNKGQVDQAFKVWRKKI